MAVGRRTFWSVLCGERGRGGNGKGEREEKEIMARREMELEAFLQPLQGFGYSPAVFGVAVMA